MASEPSPTHGTEATRSTPSLSLPEDRDGGRNFSTHVLVAKVVVDKRFSAVVLKSICSRASNLNNRLDVKELGTNIFLLSFEDPDDQFRIMMETLWSVAGNHLVIKEWPCHLALKEIDFSISECWVQVHGLNPSQLSKENGWPIGDLIGSCVRVDTTEDNRLSYSGILRLRVLFNVHKPLLPGFYCTKSNGERSWISFIYEKKSDFCYNCGLLDHREKSCKKPILPPCSPFTPGRWGVWLKAESGFAKWSFSKYDWDLRKRAASSSRSISSSSTQSGCNTPVDSNLGVKTTHALSPDVDELQHQQARERHDEFPLDHVLEPMVSTTGALLLDTNQSFLGDLSFSTAELSQTGFDSSPLMSALSVCEPLVTLRTMSCDSAETASTVLNQYMAFGEIISGALHGPGSSPSTQESDNPDITLLPKPAKPKFGFKRFGPTELSSHSKRLKLNDESIEDISSVVEYSLDYADEGSSSDVLEPYFRVVQRGTDISVMGRPSTPHGHICRFRPSSARPSADASPPGSLLQIVDSKLKQLTLSVSPSVFSDFSAFPPGFTIEEVHEELDLSSTPAGSPAKTHEPNSLELPRGREPSGSQLYARLNKPRPSRNFVSL
ncbi:hypothetical protein Tsubulata_040743 [Turnera subulata]|uniref:Zinc knuckle CX2CX4HX4C domain-containing protein n=1 Tax=Turnera subulata TaxID=218843 RepID=A0A9Q0FX92_9ROSI|nr:hypothetical protein Tsubulata_040743 [Turnera subulata]